MDRLNLIEYLPTYYHHSRQMVAIQQAVGFSIPDVENDLWKVFFLSLGHPDSLELWARELGVSTEDKSAEKLLNELLAKMSITGPLTRKFIRELGYGLIEPWRDMKEHPEKYLDNERQVLTSIFVAQPDTIDRIRDIVDAMGCYGFQYFFQVQVHDYVEVDCFHPISSFITISINLFTSAYRDNEEDYDFYPSLSGLPDDGLQGVQFTLIDVDEYATDISVKAKSQVTIYKSLETKSLTDVNPQVCLTLKETDGILSNIFYGINDDALSGNAFVGDVKL